MPLTSLWLDTLVLRLMNQGQPHPRRTWFVLDELASLQRLPQLHTAITENRKSNNPVVLGFQGRSQLETRYGHDAEAMLSQPATKIFLRTSEPHAAKWIADTIGDVEIERLRESRSHGRGGQQTLRLGTPGRAAGDGAARSAASRPLRGYLKLGNLVVRLSFPFIDLPRTAARVHRTASVRSRDRPAPTASRRRRASGAATREPTHIDADATRAPVSEPADRSRAGVLVGVGGQATMLTISKPFSAAQVRTYHAEEFSNARDNYYTAGRRDPRPVARPARRPVGAHRARCTRRPFQRLADGQHPLTGEPLVHHQTARPYTNAARRDGHDDGASRRLGCDVLGARRACR